MDLLQWMGAVRIRVQMSCVKYVFIRKKSNCCFWPQYESIIHNIASSSEQVHPLLSSNIKIHRHLCLGLFWAVLACNSAWSVHISLMIQTRLFHRAKQYYRLRTRILVRNNNVKLKNLIYIFVSWKCSVSLQILQIDWLLLYYCDVFISSLDSFWRHPFTAEDPLVSKWWKAKFWWRNRLILDGLRV